jgi:hypothetical protein
MYETFYNKPAISPEPHLDLVWMPLDQSGPTHLKKLKASDDRYIF